MLRPPWLYYSTHVGIRTQTEAGLSRFPLPLGYVGKPLLTHIRSELSQRSRCQTFGGSVVRNTPAIHGVHFRPLTRSVLSHAG